MVSPDAVQLSQEFFENPDSYADFNAPFGECVDPRDPKDKAPGEYFVLRQTAGSAVGIGYDRAVASTTTTGEFMSVEYAMRLNELSPGFIIWGAHYRCAFAAGIQAVGEEIVSPSPFTVDSTERLSRDLGVWDDVEPALKPVRDAAKLQAEYHQKQDSTADLVKHAQYTVHVHGENDARIYTVSLHPYKGVNRNVKPRDEKGISLVKGYSDTLGANVHLLRVEPGFNNEERRLRLASMISRSAATRTVITRDIVDEMTFLEIDQASTSSGMRINELQVA
jgi:hypothetical protein